MSFPAGMSPRSMAIADYNGDGHLDVVVADFSGGNVTLFLAGNGLGGFAAPLPLPPPPAVNNPRWAVSGDFDGDGKPDVAVANANTNNVTLYLGDGTGRFVVGGVYQAGGPGNGLAAGDLNGDGLPDLAVAASGATVVLINLGQGKLANPQSVGPGVDVSSVVTADFNGDGRLDLATSDRGSGAVTLLLNTSK